MSGIDVVGETMPAPAGMWCRPVGLRVTGFRLSRMADRTLVVLGGQAFTMSAWAPHIHF